MNKLIEKLHEKASETSFSGVVSINLEGKQLYAEAFGYADTANKRKNNLKTRFAIASGTKLFTALGIGTLVDKGLVSLNSTTADIFGKDFSFIDPKATIAQLLTHSSGIWDYYDEDLGADSENFFVEIPWSKLETPSDYLPLFNDKTPKFTAGERFSYSNGGYIFLGIIIEHITGKLYRDHISENVFLLAGMNDSGYFVFNNLPANTAFGYKTNGDTNIYNLPIRGGSDGGAYTTIGDLKKLWKALFNHKIQSKELTADFLTSHIIVEDTVNYGYGIYISKFNGMDMYYFVGGDAGVGFDCRYFPQRDLQITIISNKTDGEEKIRDVIYTNFEDIL